MTSMSSFMVFVRSLIIKSVAHHTIFQGIRCETLPQSTYWSLEKRHERQLEMKIAINTVRIVTDLKLESLEKQEFPDLQD
jgi:hypothetical protein